MTFTPEPWKTRKSPPSMTRVHVERELPTSKSPSTSRNSRLFPAPTGAQVTIFTSVTGLPFYRGTSTLPGKNSFKNQNKTQTKTKNPKESTTKKPQNHPNQKLTPQLSQVSTNLQFFPPVCLLLSAQYYVKQLTIYNIRERYII